MNKEESKNQLRKALKKQSAAVSQLRELEANPLTGSNNLAKSLRVEIGGLEREIKNLKGGLSIDDIAEVSTFDDNPLISD